MHAGSGAPAPAAAAPLAGPLPLRPTPKTAASLLMATPQPLLCTKQAPPTAALPPSPAPHLRVGVGAQVAVEERGGGVEQLAQLVAVGQVAVVDHVDAQGGVDEEGLGRGKKAGGTTRKSMSEGMQRLRGETAAAAAHPPPALSIDALPSCRQGQQRGSHSAAAGPPPAPPRPRRSRRWGSARGRCPRSLRGGDERQPAQLPAAASKVTWPAAAWPAAATARGARCRSSCSRQARAGAAAPPPATPPAFFRPACPARTLERVQLRLLGEDVLDQAVGLVLLELLPVGGHHAGCRARDGTARGQAEVRT